MPHPKFRGAIPALVTPFKNGAVDEQVFTALVERQIAAGVHGLVPVGTTGESATLTTEEHMRVVRLCVEVTQGRVPVIGGAGANATAHAIELAKGVKAAGADAALIVTPYYNRPSQEGLYQHFKAINDAVDLPVILYNVPGRTGVDLSNETTARLAQLPNIAGIKDATGDLSRPSFMRLECREDFALITGDDPSALGYMAHGGCGVISVTSNVAPEGMARLMDACLEDRWDNARAEQDRLIALHKALFLDASPSPTKFALAQLGLCSDETRLPIAPCAEAVKPQILNAMRTAGLNV
ncbi:MAG: 4-hydroxy-tetrahydrodipicolinate synthase [Caulobacteraceae bacterium]